MGIYELCTRYDSRKSFYSKAIVECTQNIEKLYSYSTKVVEFDLTNNKIVFFPMWDCSKTTLRHVKEYLCQHGHYVKSIKDIRELIKKGTITLAEA